EGDAAVDGAVQDDVGAVVVVVVGVDHVDVAAVAAVRVVDGDRREVVDAIVADDLIDGEEGRGHVDRRLPGDTVVERAREADAVVVAVALGGEARPGDVGVLRVRGEGGHRALAVDVGGGDDDAGRP